MKLYEKLDWYCKEITNTIYKIYDGVPYCKPKWFLQEFSAWFLWSCKFSAVQIEKDIRKISEGDIIKYLSKNSVTTEDEKEMKMFLNSRFIDEKELNKMTINKKLSTYLTLLVIEDLREKDFIL